MAEYNRDFYCNACGGKLEIIPKANVCKEHLSVEKEWGYFSSKDFMVHSFNVCEPCYDKWIDTFTIPIEEKVQTEWAGTLPEETLNLEYKKSRQ